MDINVRLREAREERASTFDQLRGIQDTADTESRDLTSEEQQTYDRLDARLIELGGDDGRGGKVAQLERYRDQLRIENGGEPTGRRGQVVLDDDGDDPQGSARTFGSYEEYLAAEGRGRPNAQPGYDAAFYRMLQGGLTDRAYGQLLEEQRQLIDRGRAEPGEAESRALSAVVGAEGGYLVPATTENRVIEQADEVSPLRQLAEVMVTGTGAEINVPIEAEIGDADWVAENTLYPEVDVVFGLAKFRAFKVATTVFIPRELLTDSAFNIEQYLIRVLGRRIGEAESLAFAVGAPVDPTNPGKPSGVYARLAVGATATGGGAGGIFAVAKPLASDDLIDLQESVRPAYQPNARWVFGQDAAKAARKLKTTDGQYILVPGLRDGETDSLLGRPMLRDPFLPAAAAGGTLAAYGDFRAGIIIRDVAGVYIQRLNELRATKGQVGFLADHRTDLNIVNAAAVKRLKAAAAV